MEDKGQASVEYLVILGVVLIIALVVVAALGGFLNIGKQAGPQASKTYWRTAEIGLMDWVIESDTGVNDVFVVKNNLDYRIKVKSIYLDNANCSNLSAFELTPGEQNRVIMDCTTCSEGNSYSYEVKFLYDNVDSNVTDKVFVGASKIEGTCA